MLYLPLLVRPFLFQFYFYYPDMLDCLHCLHCLHHMVGFRFNSTCELGVNENPLNNPYIMPVNVLEKIGGFLWIPIQ